MGLCLSFLLASFSALFFSLSVIAMAIIQPAGGLPSQWEEL